MEFNTMEPMTTANYSWLENNGSGTNTDDVYEMPIKKGVIIFFIAALPLIAITGLVGNILFMFVFYKVQSMKTLTNYYLLSLSIADSLFLGACIPLEVFSFLEAVSGESSLAVCILWTFFNMVPLFTSIFTIALISVERYIAICHPLQAKKAGRHKRILGLIITSWVVATLLALLYLVGCFNMSINLYIAYAICQILPFLFSLFVVVILYIPVIRQMKKNTLASASIRSSQNANQYFKDRRQVVKLLLITTVVFFVCMFPDCFLTLQMVLAVLGQPVPIPWDVYYNLFFFCRLLLYLNSAVNPVIYNAASSKYRRAFRKTFSHCCKKVDKAHPQFRKSSSVMSSIYWKFKSKDKKKANLGNDNDVYIISGSSTLQLQTA
ncbi:neuropeptides capa receptor-like [Glandiceps talaboti]